MVISQTETTEFCDIYASDVLGLIQNDPRYATIIKDTGDLKNMPQKHLEHHLLTASATVDGNAVTMLTDNGSANAEARCVWSTPVALTCLRLATTEHGSSPSAALS